MKHFTKPLIGLMLLGSLVGCSEKTPTPEQKPSLPTYQEKYGDFVFTKTNMKDEFYSEVPNKGKVETLTYETNAYAYEAKHNLTEHVKIVKKLQVYLPYNYDENKQYDIAYFMHGGGDNEEYWLTKRGEYILPTLDNLMYNKKCRETIIVCPTFYSNVEGNIDESLFSQFPKYFPLELENEIIPLVETKYSTYANKIVTEESLIASRDHRAFAGLSMGSMTAHNVLCKLPDKISYIGCFSGEMTKEREDHGFGLINEALHSEEFNKYKINYWYNQNGTMDMAHDPHEALSKKVLAEMSDKFKDGENYAWIDIKGGAHAFNVWRVGLYNSLQLFFPVNK